MDDVHFAVAFLDSAQTDIGLAHGIGSWCGDQKTASKNVFDCVKNVFERYWEFPLAPSSQGTTWPKKKKN
jgi:hypothetical protein